jgi:hypothetical protein
MLLLLGLVVVSALGCTKTFDIRPVQVPQNVYAPATQTAPRTVALNDARSGAARPFSTGTLSVVFRGMDDEVVFLGENLARVLGASGINVTYAPAAPADVTLRVHTYRMRNLRTSGFSPYHTFTTFSADLVTSGPSRRITAYFKNSKVPVWAFREVERPCYQIPLEVVVKEIAAKLNAHVFGRVTPTDVVHRLAASIPTGPADAASEQYLKVLELGYTNNREAVPHLVPLTDREETLMRASAISALGMLGAKDQLPLLTKLYESRTDLVRAMALKSIGDLDTPEARDFLRRVKASKDYGDETIREVVDLYAETPRPVASPIARPSGPSC